MQAVQVALVGWVAWDGGLVAWSVGIGVAGKVARKEGRRGAVE